MTGIHSTGFAEGIISTLFPPVCPLCRAAILKRKEALCCLCLSNLRLIQPPFCSRCGEPLEGRRDYTSGYCLKCLRENNNQLPDYSVRSTAWYTETLRKAILAIKYGGHAYIASSLGLFLKGQYNRFFTTRSFDRIIPVPLHPKRLREREFNQCVLLARPLAKSLQLPLDLDAVIRARHTLSQSVSKKTERKRNLKGAFRVVRPSAIRGQSLFIVDDVYTTGATLEALAESLFASGAKNVTAFTLARSPLNDKIA